MTGWYEPVLDRLDKVRKTGDNKWNACCPVHDDTTPSMGLRVVDTAEGQKLLINCFACGARGDSVVESIGLKVGDLFEKDREFTPDPDHLLRKTQENDDWLIVIYDSAKARGERIKYKDHQAYMQAMARRQNRAERGIPQTIIEVDKPEVFL